MHPFVKVDLAGVVGEQEDERTRRCSLHHAVGPSRLALTEDSVNGALLVRVQGERGVHCQDGEVAAVDSNKLATDGRTSRRSRLARVLLLPDLLRLSRGLERDTSTLFGQTLFPAVTSVGGAYGHNS